MRGLAEGQSWGEPRLVAYALQRLAEVYAANGRRALALQTAEDVRARFERLGIARRELAELAERLRREDALLAELLVGPRSPELDCSTCVLGSSALMSRANSSRQIPFGVNERRMLAVEDISVLG